MDNDFIIVQYNVTGIIIAITISIKGCVSFNSRKKFKCNCIINYSTVTVSVQAFVFR